MNHFTRHCTAYKIKHRTIGTRDVPVLVPITVASVSKDGKVKRYWVGHNCDRKHNTLPAYRHDVFIKEAPNEQA